MHGLRRLRLGERFQLFHGIPYNAGKPVSISNRVAAERAGLTVSGFGRVWMFFEAAESDG